MIRIIGNFGLEYCGLELFANFHSTILEYNTIHWALLISCSDDKVSFKVNNTTRTNRITLILSSTSFYKWTCSTKKKKKVSMDMDITQTWIQCLCFSVPLSLSFRKKTVYRTFEKRLFTVWLSLKSSLISISVWNEYLMHSTFTFEMMQNANANASKLTSYTFIRVNWMETVLTLRSNQIPSSHHSAFVGLASKSMVFFLFYTLLLCSIICNNVTKTLYDCVFLFLLIP